MILKLRLKQGLMLDDLEALAGAREDAASRLISRHNKSYDQGWLADSTQPGA